MLSLLSVVNILYSVGVGDARRAVSCPAESDRGLKVLVGRGKRAHPTIECALSSSHWCFDKHRRKQVTLAAATPSTGCASLTEVPIPNYSTATTKVLWLNQALGCPSWFTLAQSAGESSLARQQLWS